MSGLQVCLELCEQELRLLVYFPEKRRGHLLNLNQVKFDSRPIPGGWLEQGQVVNQTLTEVLREVRRVYKIPRSTPTRLALPLVQGFLREYRLPWIAPRYRETAIGYLAKEETPIPPNQQVIGYTVTHADEQANTMTVRLGVMRRPLFEQIIRALYEAGFQPTMIAFSLAAIGCALDFQPHQRSFYLSETQGGIQMILYQGILPEVTRFFPLLPGADPKEWIPEISRIFGLIHSEVPIRHIWISQQESSVLFAESLLETRLPGLDPQTEILSIEEYTEQRPWRKSLPSQVLPCLACLGLASESEAKAKRQNVNLLSEYQEKASRKQQKQWAFILVLVFLIVNAGIWLQGKQQQDSLQREIQTLKATAGTIQAQEKIGTLVTPAGTDDNVTLPGIAPALIFLQSLTGQGVSLTQLEYKEERLTLQGTAEQAVRLEELLRNLQAQSWGQIRFLEYRQEKPALIHFTLTAVYGDRESPANH